MELHPCACGATGAPDAHEVRTVGLARCSVWTGACPTCGATRRCEVALPDGPPAQAGTFGGSRPSEIITPEEFLRVSDAAARRVGTRGERSAQAFRDLRHAIACVREVLKFFPPGTATIAAIPVSRERLEARLAAYEALLATA
jgi:hypothetical protein